MEKFHEHFFKPRGSAGDGRLMDLRKKGHSSLLRWHLRRFCFMAGKVKNQKSDAVLQYEATRQGEIPVSPALPTSSV